MERAIAAYMRTRATFWLKAESRAFRARTLAPSSRKSEFKYAHIRTSYLTTTTVTTSTVSARSRRACISSTHTAGFTSNPQNCNAGQKSSRAPSAQRVRRTDRNNHMWRPPAAHNQFCFLRSGWRFGAPCRPRRLNISAWVSGSVWIKPFAGQTHALHGALHGALHDGRVILLLVICLGFCHHDRSQI